MKNILFLALCVALTSAGLLRAEEKKPAATAVSTEAWKNKTFTLEELKKYNGQDGMPSYVAMDGIVYDLSKSKLWKLGEHMHMHHAGADLSYEMHNKAPKGIHHDGKILETMPRVGVLLKTPVTAETPAAGKTVPIVTPHKISKEEIGKDERCAVTRKALKVAETTPAVEYKGKTYYFSSGPLADKFTKEPEKYLSAIKEKSKAVSKKKA